MDASSACSTSSTSSPMSAWPFGRRLKSIDVIDVISDLFIQRGIPEHIRSDNGPEFSSKKLNLWAFMRNVTLDFSRPGKPTDNAFIESLNGKFRAECLNANW